MLLQLFQDGGWAMWPLLVLLIFGIAITIERLYNLSKAAINAEKFFEDLEGRLRSEGPDSAAELCSQTQGPVASVIHAGLMRLERGIDHVEKAIENAGAVEMAFLERGMIWLSTVANLAPMIGFLGTVSGMINAFQAIKQRGDVVPRRSCRRYFGGPDNHSLGPDRGYSHSILPQPFCLAHRPHHRRYAGAYRRTGRCPR